MLDKFLMSVTEISICSTKDITARMTVVIGIINWLMWYNHHPSSVSLSHQEASTNLILPYQRAERQNHNHRKLTNLITWTTALSNSMKLWAMPCRATQERWVMVESSDKTWSMFWRRECQISSVFLLWEPNEQYE